MTSSASTTTFDPASITRPDPALWNYYIIVSLLTVAGFPFIILPLYFKYRTLLYRFDDKGVAMSYGMLNRREIYLTYRRIQDIHVNRNIIHRWLGLAELSVQTASGTSGAEMKIEGIRNPEALRDFLYTQMRGARDEAEGVAPADAATGPTAATATADEALVLLREIRDEVRALPSSPQGRRMSAAASRASAWIYTGVWSVLVRFFRVPHEPPTLPVREGDFVQSFRPSEGLLRYLKFWFWLLFWPMDVGILVAWIAILIAVPWLAVVLIIPALLLAILPDVLVYIGIHLRYDTTWYVMTDRSIRIRRGIWVIHETTITFENVQNMKVQQGPVQRHFGIADLIIETAGAGAPAGKHGGTVGNRGMIEGVANAHELRDRILQRVRVSSSAGLGDEEHSHSGPAAGRPQWTAAHLAALRELRDEVRGLAASGA